MNETITSIPGLLGIAIVQLAVFALITQWLARRSDTDLRWIRILGLALALCFLSLPFIVILISRPPKDPNRQRNLAIAAAFVPIAAAQIIAFVRMWQQRRRKEANEPNVA
jgi:hypothetical protein